MKDHKSQPPRWPLRFFRWFCHPNYQEDIEGDLLERFEKRVEEKGNKAAKWGFAKDVIQLFRPGIIRSLTGNYRLDQYDMYKNIFKVAYRNLLRNKVFGIINILGLVIGITASMLIFRYVQFEHSYDDFHVNGEDIYRICAEINQGEIKKTVLTPPPLASGLQENYPEAINFTRLILPWSGQAATSTLSWLDKETKAVKHSFKWGFYTDPGFLQIFSFPWIKGNQQTALIGTNKVVLAESTAKKIFGNDWAKNDHIIGQVVEYVNEFDRFPLTITGIIADAPENSHFQYDFLASFSTLSTGWAKGYAETWGGNKVYAYLQLAPNTDISLFTNKAESYFKQNSGESYPENTDFVLQPLQDIYLNSHMEGELRVNGNASYVSFLSFIATAILLIALINYINLTTAKAVIRGHEVGLRKVMGALRPQLIKQFFFESMLINGIAFFFAIILLLLISPYMDQFTGKSINYMPVEFWLFILVLFPLNTMLSGLYPALVLSGYNPIKTLKGNLVHSPKGNNFRKYLVVFQFCISMGLIIFTFTIYRQLHHMRNQETGFEKEGVLVVNGPVNRAKTWIEHDKEKDQNKYNDRFKDILSQYSGIKAASLSWSVPGGQSSIYAIELGELNDNGKLDVINADNDYAEVYGLELIAGEFVTNQDVVINESAAAILGYKKPAMAIGKEFKDQDGRGRVIKGVVKDYHHHSLQQEIHPIMFQQNDPSYKLDSYYSIKVGGSNLAATLEKIDAAYKQAYPYNPFEYYFIDTYFDAQYRADIQFGTLFGLFSGIALFIAFLGLFGLSLHTVALKTKEIGIRKVLGASEKSILALLTRSSLKLITIACILALPITYWVTEKWLSNYAFRIELGWLFILPVLLVPAIVLLTISSLSIKAASMNLTEILRSE